MGNIKKQQGFTFVELSISMLIIGLLIVSILAGSSIIRSAKLRSVITDITNYQSAFNLFVSKYGAMPGDISDITSALSAGANPLYNGNGDNQIVWDTGSSNCTNSSGTAVSCSEGAQAWNHMATAGMLPGSFTGTGSNAVVGINIPASKINNAGYAIDYSNGTAPSGSNNFNDATTTGNHLRFAVQGGGGINSGAALSPTDAENMDNKVDDGIPNTGRVQDTGLAGCSAAGAYNLAGGDAPACALDIQLDSGS